MIKKNSRRCLSSIVVFTMLFSSIVTKEINSHVIEAKEEESYTQYVDPFVGTDVDYGQLFPGSVVPSGLVKLSPDTYPHKTDDHAGYDYSKDRIQGFSHTRIEGVGGQGAGGDVLVTPTYVKYTKRPEAATKGTKYKKETEEAHPGYYSVELTPKSGEDNGAQDDSSIGLIKAEMTSDVRTGYHRYTFPKTGEVNLLVDLNYTYHGTDIRDAILDVVEESDETTAISGRFSGKNVSGHGKYTMYFYLETSKPAKSTKTWNGTKLTKKTSQTGNDLGAILNFDVEQDETVEVKVSISPISAEQAKTDMYNEIPGWNFEDVRTAADTAWNEVLGKIRVENSVTSDPDGRLKKLFYTHLYHMFTTPVNATSTSNTYRGTDTNIYEANDYVHYDSWTLWDDYRKYPMIGLVMPNEYKDMVRSLADALETGIGTWGIETQPIPTVRTEHAVALLADAVAKGFDDIDNLDIAYQKVKEIANNTVNSEAERLGYIKDRVDRTVEFAYDDWAISLIAKELGYDDEAEYYLNRSFNYMNLYKDDAVTLENGETIGLLWPKDSSGNWKSANPEKYGDNGLYQGTLWQFTWYDSNDVNGLMNLMGGKDNMLKALSRLYGEQDPDNGKAMLHTNTNEIDLHTPYLFNYAGKPSRTQYWVRQIYSKQTWNRYSGTGEFNPPIYDYVYKLAPNGFMETMDDDAGTMAAMYVAAAMGFFPMTPGDTTFQIGSPFFEKVTLDVGDGKTFTIEANNVSEDNFYIQSATLNGKELNRTWIDYSEITRGGVLRFEMGNTPSSWAEDGVPAKSSSDTAMTSAFSNDEVIYSNSMFEESIVNDGSMGNTIAISLKTLQFTGNINDDLYASGKIEISNIPVGLTASAIKVADNKVEVRLLGNASKHTLNDSIGNLKIELRDSSTSATLSSIYKVRDNIKVMFSDDRLTYSSYALKESSADDGSIIDTATITLSGDASFSGNNSENFVDNGKVKVHNVPEGLVPVITKTSEKTAVLSFLGKAVNHDVAQDIAIDFQDAAFINGTASTIQNSSSSGMTALHLDFYFNYKTKLKETITRAEKIKEGIYTDSSYKTLISVVNRGKEILEKEEATQKETQDAYYAINNAMDKLKTSIDGLTRLEAEKSNDWSGGDLKNEAMNLGGTYDGAWIKYDAVDFSGLEVNQITVRYVNNSSRCASDSVLEIRKDGPDGEIIGTIALPPNDSSWNTYTTVKADLTKPEALTGVHDIYFVMHGTTTDAKPYIANIDYMQFSESQSYERYEAENYDTWSGGSLKKENSTDSNNNTLTNLGGTYDGAWISYDEVIFNGNGLHQIHVRYVNNSERCGDNARLDIYLDSMNGDPIHTIPIPATGSNWNNYEIVSSVLETPITGKHKMYIVMRADANKPYVANIDWFEFEEKVDKTELDALYRQCEALLAYQERYEETGFKQFKAAMKRTLDVLEDEEAIQSDVRLVTKGLQKAIPTLRLLIIDELDTLVSELESMESTGYTSDSYATLQEAIVSAKAISEDSTYDVYKAAYDRLEVAKGQLTRFDKTALEAIIVFAEDIHLDDYYEEGKTEFIAALTKAKEINEAVSLTQKEIDDVVTNLKTTMDALKAKPDVAALENLIKEAEKLDLTKYEEKGQEEFKETLMEAKKQLENPTSAEAVQEAIRNLQIAMDNLVKKEKNEEENGGSITEKPTSPSTLTPSKNTTQQAATGIGDSSEQMIFLGILSLVLIGIIKKKKSNLRNI